jgi:hypothetical protein
MASGVKSDSLTTGSLLFTPQCSLPVVEKVSCNEVEQTVPQSGVTLLYNYIMLYNHIMSAMWFKSKKYSFFENMKK